MSQIRIFLVISALLVCLSLVVVDISEAQNQNSEIAISHVEYDSSTGTVHYSGTADSDCVNIRIYSDQYSSPISACIVEEGSYSDSIFLGKLDSGVYHLEVSYNSVITQHDFVVGNAEIVIKSVSFDSAHNLLLFEGQSSFELVNVRVYSDDYSSPIDACVVKGGLFADSMYLGNLKNGDYTLEVSNGSNKSIKVFTIGSDYILVDSVYYEDDAVSFEGSSSFDIINLVVYGPDDYVSSVSAVAVKSGQFKDTFYLGALKNGTYQLHFSVNDYVVVKEFTVDEIDPYVDYSVYSEDGKQLIRFDGTVSEYVLPLQIESISEGAFDDARIDTFVYTKDVRWDIKIKNNTFPLQNASIKHLVIKEGVCEIPDYLFACLDINELFIPASVEKIGIKSFYLCPNLKTIEIAPDSHMKTVGAYAFSSNESLEVVKFNDSAESRSCIFDEGSFFACGEITVRLSAGFILKEIGSFAFANDQVTMLIDDETGNTIHVPSTVEKIGKKAFSRAEKATGNEPGLNTVHNRDMASVAALDDVYNSGATGRSIVFSPNAHLKAIPNDCFNGVFVDSIDLSGCSALTTVGINAFAYCLDTCGGAGICWPDNLQTIGAAAFRCRGSSDSSGDVEMTLPASVVRIEQHAFYGLCQRIIFQSGSELSYFSGSIYPTAYHRLDLSNCSKLLTLGTGWQCAKEILLPSGMFFLESKNGHTNIDSLVTPTVVLSGGVLEIGSDTKAILYRSVEGLTGITCDSSNNTFQFTDGVLSCHVGGTTKVLLLSGVRTARLLGDASQSVTVSSVAVGPSVVSLYLPSDDISIDAPILTNATGLKSVYLCGEPRSWNIQTAFDKVKPGVTYYVPDSLDVDDLTYLKGLGNVYVGYSTGEGTFYCPSSYNGHALILSNLQVGEGSLSAEISIEGYDISDLDLALIGGRIAINSNKILVDHISESMNAAYLRISEKSHPSEGMSYVTFDDGDGDIVVVSVRTGTQLTVQQIPKYSKNGHDLIGWKTADDDEFSLESPITHDLALSAVWVERAPKLIINQDAALILLNGELVSDEYIVSNQPLQFIAMPKSGFEIQKWILNGEEVSDAALPLNVTLQSDSTLAVSYRYYSQSTGMNNVNDTGLPTTEEIQNIVHAYTIGGYVNTNGSVWTGMTSIPLIVDNYVYVRIAGMIYKAESDTGYIVKSVQSVSKEAFYHYLGYGDGFIIDYNSSKVFDLDLNQLYVLGRSIESADYYDGRFYALGDEVYSFDPSDEDPSRTDEVKELTLVGRTDGMYHLYGIYPHEFVDGVVYYMTSHGRSRGVGAMDLSNGATSDLNLKSIEYMFLDDGWLTYYDGYLFITAYSDGLFGATSTSHGSRLAYVPVNGLEFGEEKYYEFGAKTFSSRVAIYDSRLFVAIAGTLHVFDLPDNLKGLDLSILPHRDTTLVSGHGNFVLDVSHITEEGAPIYAYGIPYDTHQGPTFWIAEDRAGRATSISTDKMEREWNSQTIRSDIDGRMIWYNDTGWLYSYTVSEKNVYYFFIEDGDSAVWYEAYGATVADALASLGSGIATINSANAIQTINGHDLRDGFTIEMLKPTFGTYDNNKQFNNLDQYSWVLLEDLSDASYSLNHYYRIVCGNGTEISSGDSFVYLDGVNQKTYRFADNVGDRTIVGKLLCRGSVEDAVTVSFVEDNQELTDYTLVVTSGTPAKVHLPQVIKAGYYPIWSDKEGKVIADIYDVVFDSDSVITLTWAPLPPKYLVDGNFTVSGGVVAWSANLIVQSGIGELQGIHLKVTAITESGRIIETYGLTEDGIASGSFSADDVKMIYMRVISDGVNGNFGYSIAKKESGI